MTRSDRELKTIIAYYRKHLANPKLGSWTRELYEQYLAQYEAELARPRSERHQFQLGTL